MKIVEFRQHIAVLESNVGIGVLVLPEPVDFGDNSRVWAGVPAATMARRWFGPNVADYCAMMNRLASLGWVLPHNNQAARAWYLAGRSDCCGRAMISLEWTHLDDDHHSVQLLTSIASSINRMVAETCCLGRH